MAEGSELDLELKRELKGSVELSRTDLKKESDRRQELGEALVTLRADLLAKLGLSDKLVDALAETRHRIGFARLAYNDQVLTFNEASAQFPTVVLARVFGFFPLEPLVALP